MNTWRPTAIFVKTFFWYGFSTRDRIDSERWAHLIFHLVVWRRRDSITQSAASEMGAVSSAELVPLPRVKICRVED